MALVLPGVICHAPARSGRRRLAWGLVGGTALLLLVAPLALAGPDDAGRGSVVFFVVGLVLLPASISGPIGTGLGQMRAGRSRG